MVRRPTQGVPAPPSISPCVVSPRASDSRPSATSRTPWLRVVSGSAAGLRGGAPWRGSAAGLHGPDVLRFRPLTALDDVELDLLAF
jgi:hypothetical protein